MALETPMEELSRENLASRCWDNYRMLLQRARGDGEEIFSRSLGKSRLVKEGGTVEKVLLIKIVRNGRSYRRECYPY